MWQGNEKDDTSLDSSEKQKEEKLSRVMLTILQLLADGANPKLVTCPHSAIFTAIMSGCPNLIEHLVNYGADINELYPMVFGYTPLDLAVSRPLSFENLEMVKVVLKCGGLPNHRLNYEETTSLNSPEIELHGPSLLHAVLAKQPENEVQEEIQHSLLEVLLDYGCNPIVQFKGRSALEIAMTKNMRLLNVFIENRTTNLNSIINDGNQSLLVKFFSMPFFKNIASADRVQTLTNLLLFGADPLLECRNGEDRFPNIFVFAKKTLTDLENIPSKSPATNSPNKADSKKVKEDPKKPKKEQLSTKPSGKMITDDVGDYKQAIDLIVECARLLHVRWLQAKLTRDLVEIIVNKTKILATTKLTADEKYSIELTVCRLLKERKMTSKLKASEMKWKRPYVQPELTPKTEELKFNVCFECALPFDEEKIECMSCKLVAFCSIECIKTNIGRANCHPCSEYIKRIYFSTPSESDNLNFDNDYLLSK
ncbi:unnamed protein product [Diatraea saccharalis]|uniref:Uncharacterized protein n=1 Tax=Diatraea saccharalis TaxID=40085 RepID=A0A9N9RGI7_9NEOP|nr:unnamed protein product [Diatraea saccharalis]